MSEKQNIIDFLKNYHPSTPATYKIATSLLAGLNKSSLEELALVAEDQFIRYRVKRQLAAPKGLSRNTSFNKLLTLYTNKMSGKVVPSLNELFRRFAYLDPSQQKRVVEAFLYGSASDAKKMAHQRYMPEYGMTPAMFPRLSSGGITKFYLLDCRGILMNSLPDTEISYFVKS